MLVLQNNRWALTEGTPKPLRDTVFWQMGCPAGCNLGPLRGGTVRIERSNPRSLTLACKVCGLHWTMTLHQLAKSAPSWDWHPLLGDDAAEHRPKYLAALAAEVPETRGRRKA